MRSVARWILAAVAFQCLAVGAPDEARMRDVGYVFHPVRVALELGDIGERILLFSQAASVMLVIGGLLARMRRGGANLEHIASMILIVGFISTVPLWRTLVAETGDAIADAMGNRAVSVPPLETVPADGPVSLTPFMLTFGQVLEHWTLASSPSADGLDGMWKPGDGREEQWLGKSWNWAKPPVFAASTPAEQTWSVATSVERAGLVQRIILGVAFVAQVTQSGFYLAEAVRWVLFHAGFALMPLVLAGLGSESLRGIGLRCMIGLLGVSLWPTGWSALNTASLAMMRAAVDIMEKTAHAALYPEMPAGTVRTLAQAAPHLSWALIVEMTAITVVLCGWMLLTLVLVPVVAHGLTSAGARWVGSAGKSG